MAKSTSKPINEREEEMKGAVTEIASTPDVTSSVIDLNIDSVKLKRIRVNGNNDAILELNIADLGISHRLPEAYERLNVIMSEVADELGKTPDDVDSLTDESVKLIGDNLKKLDDNMRKEIDYIFDAPVSEVCLPHGSMYDPYQGMYQYEHIIDALTSLYESNLNREFGLMRKRVAERTEKYTRLKKSPTKKYHR